MKYLVEQSAIIAFSQLLHRFHSQNGELELNLKA
jgi:DtxR family transcriptional regulator, Mn-dependent transcriptional regulator